MNVTVVVDSSAVDESMSVEHGLSLLVRGPWGDWLVDTGASGEALLHNLQALGVSREALRSVVLTHGHYDHAGGLLALAMAGSGYSLYCHPTAFCQRYVENPGKPMKSIGSPVKQSQLHELGVRVVEVQAPMPVAETLLLSGPVGGPKWGDESFVVRRGEELVEDTFGDEMFLLAHGQKGWALLSGCCHRGLPNTLRLARFLTHGEPIVAIIGGLHLRRAGEESLASIAGLLEKQGTPSLYVGHCTGEGAAQFLSSHYQGQVVPLRAGLSLDV